ncbi:MAG TPA: AMP-binding protein, partial [Dehalococcoidia bacterium]|nr:AMP-binding protein [Dehalococcoidia bacterium]
MDTLVDLFSKAAREHGQRECVWIERADGVDAWSYQELWRRANAVAYQLHLGGVGPGERVLVYAPNSPRLVATYFGLLLLGSVIVPIDLRSSPEFMVAVREKARAHTLISGGEPPPELASAHVLSVDSLTEDAAVAPGDWRPVAPGPDDLAEIVFTSGTTGRPKGVMLTHRNIAANADSAASVLSDLANFRALSLIPLSHMFEQIALFAGMRLGASFTYVETLSPNTLFDTLRRRRVTMIPTVPQILQIFYRAIEAEVRRQGRTRIWNVAHALARRSPMPVRRR